jgi:uncharacterized membrane protein (DUF4010 family)
LKFGVLFLILRIAGILAQRWLGSIGFYAVSLGGGLISSASAVASAASLSQQGLLPANVTANGAILASLTSTLVNLPLVAQIARERPLTQRIGWALLLTVIMGLAGIAAGALLPFASRAH